MPRRRSIWVSNATEFQITAGTDQILDLGTAARSATGLTNLNGFTAVRNIINLTWQANALANDFERCFAGIVRATEAAAAAGVTAIADPDAGGGEFMWRDVTYVPRVGPEIAATPTYGALATLLRFDIRSSRKLGSDHTLVFRAGCSNNDYDLGLWVNTLYLMP